MKQLARKERNNFNAVIEGADHDDWRRLHYKLAQVPVPEEATVLNDGAYRYQLFGKTPDFARVTKVNGEAGNLETKMEIIDDLGACHGVILPYRGGIPDRLERSRTVCMRDGRIFVDHHMVTDQAYLGAISMVVKTAGEIFGDKKFSKLYRQVVINRCYCE